MGERNYLGGTKGFFWISGVYLTVECECMLYLSVDTKTLGHCLSFLWWGINERGVKRQSLLRYPFLPSFFLHIVRGYSSYDPLELHPGGQIQGAGRGDLLILAMQASITQRGRERAIFKPQRHKGGDQLADFWLYYSITGCEAEISFSNACKWMRFTGWSEFSYVLLIILPLNHYLG